MKNFSKTALCLFVFALLHQCNIFAGEDINIYNGSGFSIGQAGTLGQSNVVYVYDATAATVYGSSLPSPPCPPGGTYTIRFNVAGSHILQAYHNCVVASGQSSNYIGQYMTRGSGSYTFTFDPSNTVPQAVCVTGGTLAFQACVTNPTLMSVMAYWKQNGTLVNSQMLQPMTGACYTYNYASGSTFVADYGYQVLRPSGDFDTNGNFVITNMWFGNQQGYADTTGGSTTNTTGITPQMTASNLINNGPINWNSADTTAARDATLKAGFNGLLSAEQLQQMIAAAELGILKTQNWGAMASGGGVSNSSSGVDTRSNDWAIANVLTNAIANAGHGTNVGMPVLGAVGTNYASASAFADTAMADSGLGAHLDTIAGGSIAGVSYSDTSPIDIPIGELTMHATLMPVLGGADWSQVWTLAKQWVTWLLYIGYLYMLLKDTVDAVKILASAQGLKIPQVNAELFGIGGNWGVLLAPGLLVAMMVATGVMLAVISVTVGSGISSFFGTVTTNPLNGTWGVGVAKGLAFLLQAVPLDKVVELGIAGLVWKAIFSKALFLFTITIRALLG